MQWAWSGSTGALAAFRRWGPGLLGCGVLAGAAAWAGGLPALQARGLGALTLAMAAGLVLGQFLPGRWHAVAEPGLALARQRLLRAGVVLFGLNLTLHDVAQVGWAGVAAALVMLASTVCLAAWLGPRWLGVDRVTALLIGAGSAICGAAAVVATEPVVRSREGEATVAVSTVVLFGTLAVFLYPWMAAESLRWLPQGPAHLGVYLGATMHEVAQVVAAGRAIGPQVEASAVIEKMVRVLLLAPFLLCLSRVLARAAASASGGDGGSTGDARRGATPWFAWGFVAVVLVHSLLPLPQSVLAALRLLGGVMLGMAMAALGLGTRWRMLMRAGWRPLGLGALLWVWLIFGGAAVVRLMTGWLGA